MAGELFPRRREARPLLRETVRRAVEEESRRRCMEKLIEWDGHIVVHIALRRAAFAESRMLFRTLYRERAIPAAMHPARWRLLCSARAIFLGVQRTMRRMGVVQLWSVAVRENWRDGIVRDARMLRKKFVGRSSATSSRPSSSHSRTGASLRGSALGARRTLGGSLAWLFEAEKAEMEGTEPPAKAQRSTFQMMLQDVLCGGNRSPGSPGSPRSPAAVGKDKRNWLSDMVDSSPRHVVVNADTSKGYAEDAKATLDAVGAASGATSPSVPASSLGFGALSITEEAALGGIGLPRSPKLLEKAMAALANAVERAAPSAPQSPREAQSSGLAASPVVPLPPPVPAPAVRRPRRQPASGAGEGTSECAAGDTSEGAGEGVMCDADSAAGGGAVGASATRRRGGGTTDKRRRRRRRRLRAGHGKTAAGEEVLCGRPNCALCSVLSGSSSSASGSEPSSENESGSRTSGSTTGSSRSRSRSASSDASVEEVKRLSTAQLLSRIAVGIAVQPVEKRRRGSAPDVISPRRLIGGDEAIVAERLPQPPPGRRRRASAPEMPLRPSRWHSARPGKEPPAPLACIDERPASLLSPVPRSVRTVLHCLGKQMDPAETPSVNQQECVLNLDEVLYNLDWNCELKNPLSPPMSPRAWQTPASNRKAQVLRPEPQPSRIPLPDDAAAWGQALVNDHLRSVAAAAPREQTREKRWLSPMPFDAGGASRRGSNRHPSPRSLSTEPGCRSDEGRLPRLLPSQRPSAAIAAALVLPGQRCRRKSV